MTSPSFYAIIPATVRYSQNLEMGAKLLYGEITALAQQEGYCWASNHYFATLYNVDIRTIQRWVQSLKDQKFIELELIKEGFQQSRKIWLSKEIKEIFTERQKCHDGMTKMSPGHDKNVIHINTVNNTKNKETPPTPSKGELEVFGKFVKISKEDFSKLSEQFGKESLLGVIEEINDYLASTGKKPYKDYAATIRNWFRRRNTKTQVKEIAPTFVSKLQDGILKNCANALKLGHIVIGYDYLEFNKGFHCFKINFQDNGFFEQVEKNLRQMNLNTTWLRDLR